MPGEPHALAVNPNGNAIFAADAERKSTGSTGATTATRAQPR